MSEAGWRLYLCAFAWKQVTGRHMAVSRASDSAWRLQMFETLECSPFVLVITTLYAS